MNVFVKYLLFWNHAFSFLPDMLVIQKWSTNTVHYTIAPLAQDDLLLAVIQIVSIITVVFILLCGLCGWEFFVTYFAFM